MGEEIKLKGCPFCGAKAVFDSDDHDWQWIECTGCSASTESRVSYADDCKPLLAKKWNSRVGGVEAKGNG
ncbi:Lar family restriction alleviation protein [Microbulbifer sp. OS29]|uniref:Lar family restriction alleviation protein n=1 Tax=Microbulbifer okhotskensis TaxID=2926617 RepID=A0A9X2EQV2_9GAMM|nr:Lar family restriction alleviation protein [Microbulbifer okhotskensis]MCO1336707.1 Lar family restriction alleviation protein [Microbulbifer okhotskensis]